jgi:hypothetical protein
MAVVTDRTATYTYFTADVLTNALIAEIPFTDVSYERSIKGAGSFSGKIPVIDGSAAFNLYESTMPGRTALYVVRNDVCVWGGIIWDRSYTAKSRELSVGGNEFTSYFYHRNIWKTYTHDFSATVVVSSGVAAVTLENGEYEAPAGSSVRIIFYEVGDFQYNGYYTVLANPAPTATTFSVSAPSIPNGTYSLATVYVRTDAYDYMRQLLDTTMVDFVNIDFPNDEIEPGIQEGYRITSVTRASNIATFTVEEPHGAVLGQTVEIVNTTASYDGTYQITATPSATTFRVENTGANEGPIAFSDTTKTVTFKAYADDVATLTTSTAHGLSVGNVVEITGVDDTSAVTEVFNAERAEVASTPTADTFTYSAFNATAIPTTAANGTVAINREAIIPTYGSFPYNSDILIDYSTEGFSAKNLENKTYRGYELRSVGEELDEYSDTVDGFEYRVDCDYDAATNSFTRTFVFIPIDFPNPPAPGQVSPPSRFGADKLVFEFPGNITDISVKESAENAATRFFVVGNISDLGDDISQPYAAASATDLLEYGWPLLDQEEEKNDTADEQQLYDHALRYLNEFRPPVGDISITVNGSLDPVVGTYAPGDWCSIIADDEFIRMRLSSDMEVRDTVLVRKIDSFKVSVPNTPSFPESVTLELVTEWEVDQRG